MAFSTVWNSREFGRVEYPFRLPGVKCTACNNTWAQFSGVPFRCPPELRTEFLKPSPKLIDQESHRIMRTRLIEASNQSFLDLKPGNGLMPALCIGLNPAADIQAVYPAALIGSSQFKKDVEREGIRGLSFFELMLMELGPEVSFNERMRETVESCCNQVRVDRIDDFWLLILDSADHYFPHKVNVECTSCGFGNLGICEPDDIEIVLGRTDILEFPDIKGAVVSERLKKLLEGRGVDGFQPLHG
jgi:hypothetical protein